MSAMIAGNIILLRAATGAVTQKVYKAIFEIVPKVNELVDAIGFIYS